MPETKDKRVKVAGQHVDINYQLRRAAAEGITDRAVLASLIQPSSDRIIDLTGAILEEDDPNLPYEPHYPDREAILSLPQYPEFAAHLMALTPYVYRFYKDDPRGTTETVYDVIRMLRIEGVGVVREFLINGSREKKEKYIYDALPWQMVNLNGRQVIDFTFLNTYYFECAQMIDRACQYWEMVHRSTLTMERYNYDIFRAINNVQGIDGYRSQEAEAIKRVFAIDYLTLVIKGLPTLEAENEPSHHGNRYLGLKIAQNTHDLFTSLVGLVKIENFWTTSSSSELAHADLVEPHTIEIDGKDYPLGDAKICPSPRHRKVKPDYHGQSTLPSVKASGFDRGVASAWGFLCSNEDGHRLEFGGKYNPIPWTPYGLADYDQLVETCTYCLTETTVKRGRDWYFTAFMMDCLSLDPADGIAKETYDLDRMNFSRIKAYTDTRIALGI